MPAMPSKCQISFTHCIQDSQDYGTDSEHMVAKVFFDLTIDGRTYRQLFTTVKQLVGADYKTGEIEVGPPIGYKGPFDHVAFRNAVDLYYRKLVGESGQMIRLAPGAKNVRMRNNTLVIADTAEFDVDTSSGGSW
jgi:hypothetical protein